MLPNDRILAFRQEIIDGPNHVCLSCNKTLFRKSVKILSDKQEATLKSKAGIDFYLTLVAHHETVQKAISKLKFAARQSIINILSIL